MNCKGFGTEIVWGFSSHVLILKKRLSAEVRELPRKAVRIFST